MTLAHRIMLFAALMVALFVCSMLFDESKPQAAPISSPTATPTAPLVDPGTEDIQQTQTLSSKQEMYCYRLNQHLPEPDLTQAIEKCLSDTQGWTLAQFEEELEKLPS